MKLKHAPTHTHFGPVRDAFRLAHPTGVWGVCALGRFFVSNTSYSMTQQQVMLETNPETTGACFRRFPAGCFRSCFKSVSASNGAESNGSGMTNVPNEYIPEKPAKCVTGAMWISKTPDSAYPSHRCVIHAPVPRMGRVTQPKIYPRP